MKKSYYLFSLIAIFVFIAVSCESTAVEESTLELIQSKKENDLSKECVTIQSGEIKYLGGHYLAGESLTTGFDIYGYNYQAHLFKGLYANLYIGKAGYPPYQGDDEAYLIENPSIIDNEYIMEYYWPYRNDEVNMTWNDAWLSNKDCNGDGMLDEPAYNEVIGTGGWENFHSKGSYETENGEICKWVQHYKIIAVPADANLIDNYWYDSNGNEIGEDFWGQWAIIQKVFNDPCGEEKNGVQYLSPFRVGFGNR